MNASQAAVAAIRAELSRNARYDDESVVHPAWIRQRYECCFPGYRAARQAAVTAAWHEAGHAVAALAVGARFSSASIRHGARSEGRVHGITGGGEQAFVVDAAGQLAQRLRDWSLPGTDDELRAWLAGWRGDGGDASRFRRAIRARSGADEVAAWRHTERLLTPLRPRIQLVARALLVHPRFLPCEVVTAIAGDCRPAQRPSRASSIVSSAAGSASSRAAGIGLPLRTERP